MKFLKYFEGITDNSKLPPRLKFKIGDYVFIKRGKSYPEWQKLMFKIVSYDTSSMQPLGDELWEIGLDNRPEVQLWFSTKNLRKAKNFEIDTKKYNL